MADGKVFICYRREDSREEAELICKRLVQAFGKERVLYDVDSVNYGADFQDVIDATLSDKSTVLLPIIGPDWVDAPDKAGKRRIDNPKEYVRKEIWSAVRNGLEIIPIGVRDASIPSPDVLPDALKKLPGLNFVFAPADKFETALESFVTTLQGRFDALEAPPSPEVAEAPPGPPMAFT